jgi:hypothetical protein
MGTPGATEVLYTLGAGLQIAGVLVIAFGVLKVREQLDPQRSALAAVRRQAVAAATGFRSARQWLSRVGHLMHQAIRNLGHRLRGRHGKDMSFSGRSESHSSGSADLSVILGTTRDPPPPWGDMSVDEKLGDLHQRLQGQRDRTDRLEDTPSPAIVANSSTPSTRSATTSMHCSSVGSPWRRGVPSC